MSGFYIELARAHAPLLMIVTPLVGAALAFVSGSARLSWLIACLFACASAFIGLDLAARLLGGGAIPAIAAVGPTLRLDGVGAFGAALIALVLALVIVAVGASLKDSGAKQAPLSLALLLCVAAGWIGALFARDLIAIVAATEAAWLACVGLVAVNAVRDRGPLNGALRMFSIGGVGAALMLLGVAMLGRATGASAIDGLLANITMPNLAGAGAALMALGLAVKAGVAPMHAWSAAALGRANAMVTFGVGALGVLGALSMLGRFSAYVITWPENGAAVSAALAGLGAVSVLVGSVQAVGSRNLLRLAGYAGVSQAGCVLLSVALGSPAGFAAALIQLVALAAAALALFGGAAAGRIQSLTMIDGYGQRAPLASVAITAGALSLMGAPLTIGFLGRWRLVEAGVGAGWWWASGLVIVASLAGVFYGGRLIERMYFRRANTQFAGEGGVWRVALVPALLAAIAVIALGLAPGFLLDAANSASAMLTGIAV